MNEFDKGIPISVHLNAAKLQQVLGALFDPAHTAAVEALGDDIVHCPFNGSGRNLQVLFAQFLVIYLVHPLVDVFSHLVQAFSGTLLAWVELSETFVNLGHDLCCSSVIQECFLRLYPLNQFIAAFLVETLTSFPEVLGDVKHINVCSASGKYSSI